MRPGEERQRRLLLIPFAPGIGDMVMMEPLLRAVLALVPDWRVSMVAKEYTADLLPPRNYELVSSSYFISEAPAGLKPFHRLLPQKLIAWAAEPAMSMDLGPFERVINLFWVWESRTPFDRWWTPQWPLQTGVRHAIDLLADYLSGELGGEIAPAARVPHIQPFPEASAWARRYLETPTSADRPVATLVVSSTDALKWWDVAKWATLNEELTESGWRTVLLATMGHPHATQVFQACRTKPAWPQVDLRQLVALLALSSLVVGVDTGPLHAAAALGVPWVGIFGATNPDLIGPYDRSRGRSVVARFPKAPSCARCWLAFKNRDDRCLTLPATGCTTAVPVSEILDAIAAVSSGTLIASV